MDVLPILLLSMLLVLTLGLIGAVIWLALQRRDTGEAEQIAALRAEMNALRQQVGQNLGTVTQQVAVFGSGFMGMVSGSTVANVASTGSITIPMMKRYGFRAEHAAAIVF